MKKLILIGMLSLNSTHFYGTHIIGGELFYECVDEVSFMYKISMKLYRDCSGGSVIFDDSLYVGIYDADSVRISIFPKGLKLFRTPRDTLTNRTQDRCLFGPPNVCVEEAIYSDIIALPPRPGGYILMYQQCCRNASIVNIATPLTVGASWVIQIPDTADGGCNSAASYEINLPTIICQGEDITIHQLAIDIDGDSLVYALCYAMEVLFAGPLPPPPDTMPPFVPVPYLPGYSYLNPLGGQDTLKINAVTGWLSGKAHTLGKFVVAICVSEYRDGILLSTTKLDYHFNVTDCDSVAVADFTYLYDSCSDDHSVSFLNISTAAIGWPIADGKYHWDFGVSVTSTDTSNLKDPTFSFPDTGTYSVTLIVNRGYSCEETVIKTIQIYGAHPPLPVTINVNGNQLTASHGITFQWYLNETALSGANAQTHTVQTTGSYFVIVVDSNGCEVISDTVNISVGITEPDASTNLQVFPNPNNGTFDILLTIPFIQKTRITLTAITGQVVFQENHVNVTGSSSKSIDISELGKGMYFLRMVAGKQVFNKKVIIQ